MSAEETQRASAGKAATGESTRKRLFVFCDGTWQDGVNNTRPLTNVATLARCLAPEGSDGCLQIAYYDSGVGSVTGVPAQLVDGATGRGISAKIRNAYSFLSHNCNITDDGEQDEVILVGFSRGAFAVQCLGAFISDAGLLKKQNLYYLNGLFKIWANQKSPRGGDKFKVDQAELLRAKVVRHINITACAVWDTVSSLGGIIRYRSRPLAFVGESVPDRVKYAFHALALDEERPRFQPVLWKSKPSAASVSQCWFLGSHADIGGNGDAALGALSFLWMVGKLHGEVGVAFDRNEIGKHLRHRFLEWDFAVNKLNWAITEKRAVATMPHIGQPSPHAWYWLFLGRQVRDSHLVGTESVPSSVHFTVRLTMANKQNTANEPETGSETDTENEPNYTSRPLRSWTTRWSEQNLAKLQWCHSSGDQTLEMDEHPLKPAGEEYQILRMWCDGKFIDMSTDRGPFAEAVEAPETAKGLTGMRVFLARQMTMREGKLAENVMYAGETGALKAVQQRLETWKTKFMKR